MNINADNPLLFIPMTFETLCNLSSLVPKAGPIRPEHEPVLIAVEDVRSKGLPETAPPEAIRYILLLPGSMSMRIPVKVNEAAPSITQAELIAQGGQVKVKIDGFESGCFLTNDGGARPYVKAKKIVPITSNPPATKP